MITDSYPRVGCDSNVHRRYISHAYFNLTAHKQYADDVKEPGGAGPPGEALVRRTSLPTSIGCDDAAELGEVLRGRPLGTWPRLRKDGCRDTEEWVGNERTR